MYEMREGVIVINQEGKIQSFNVFAEDLFGYSANEVLDKKFAMLMHSNDATEICYINKCLETREKKCEHNSQVLKALKKDGTQFTIRLSITEIHLNGDSLFTGIISPVDDEDEVYHTKMTENLQDMKTLTQQLKRGKL